MSREKGTGRLVTQIELATILGVSNLTIAAWERKGCPIIEKGGRGKASTYNTADVAQWREREVAKAATGDLAAMDMDEAKRRKVAAEAAMAELDLAIAQGKYISIDEIAKVIETEYSTIRANFMSMPGEVAPDLEHRTTIETEELLTQKITEILNALAADTNYSGDDV